MCRLLVVGGGPAGLLTVGIPTNLTGDVELIWRPPLWKLSPLALASRLLLALATEAAWSMTERGDTQTLVWPGALDGDSQGA
jgi:hypothetical protein